MNQPSDTRQCHCSVQDAVNLLTLFIIPIYISIDGSKFFNLSYENTTDSYYLYCLSIFQRTMVALFSKAGAKVRGLF